MLPGTSCGTITYVSASMTCSHVHDALISQPPAFRLLMALGYQYLPPEEALALRGNSDRFVMRAMASFVTGELSDE